MEIVHWILFVVSPFVGLAAMVSIGDENPRPPLIVALVSFAIFLGSIGLQIYAADKIEGVAWKRENPYVTHKIIALSDGNEMNGRLHRGVYCSSGYINEEFMYVYGYETVSGGMKIQKASAKYATVYFDDTISPQAKWYHEERSWWFFSEERTTCDIYVPSDSLQAGITIDLQ